MKKIEVGDKLWLDGRHLPFTCKAAAGKFAICTQPYNVQKTVLYTIMDLEQGIRGTNNLVFNIYNYKEQDDIDLCMQDLLSGEIEISHRNRVRLVISRHQKSLIITNK